MTNEEKALVVKAILDRTSEWAKANCRRDAEGTLALFEDSDELRYAENGKIFPSHAALADFVKGWYETTADMLLTWDDRRVFPLAPHVATMTGIFQYRAIQKTAKSGLAAMYSQGFSSNVETAGRSFMGTNQPYPYRSLNGVLCKSELERMTMQ